MSMTGAEEVPFVLPAIDCNKNHRPRSNRTSTTLEVCLRGTQSTSLTKLSLWSSPASLVYRFAVSMGIPSGQRRNFESVLLKNVSRILDVKKLSRRTPLLLHSDGMVERVSHYTYSPWHIDLRCKTSEHSFACVLFGRKFGDATWNLAVAQKC